MSEQERTTADRTEVDAVQVTADTYLVRAHHRDPWSIDAEAPWIPVGLLLIRGEQPVIVDTGAPADRDGLLAELDRLIDLGAVRWIVLSHEDVDHAGNVEALLARCPAAELVTTWTTAQQLALAGTRLPHDRMRWVADGDAIDAGDRVIVAQTPPLYDSGTTIGLFDTTSGVYWAADCFATRVDRPGRLLEEMDPQAWRDGFIAVHQRATPWVGGVSLRRWERCVDELRQRELVAIVSAHGPVIRSGHVAAALDLLQELPELAMVAPRVGAPRCLDARR